MTATAQLGKASTERKTFSRTTTIQQTIDTDAETIWSVLTDAKEYTRWNSTITALDGNIALHEKIKLKSTLDAKRTFKLKVKVFEPNTKLVWGDAMGERTYLLEKDGNGTRFTMTEKIGGPIFPLFASKIPSFDASFEQFATDLKQEAESK